MIRALPFLTIFAVVILSISTMALNFSLRDEHSIKNADFDIVTYGAFEKNDTQYLYLTVRGKINLENSNLTKSYEVNISGSNGFFHIYIISPEDENFTLAFAATTWGRIFPFENYSVRSNNLTVCLSKQQWNKVGDITQILFSAGEMSLKSGKVTYLDRVYYPPREIPEKPQSNFHYIYIATAVIALLVLLLVYIFWRKSRNYVQ